MNDIVYAAAFAFIGAFIGGGWVELQTRPDADAKFGAQLVGHMCADAERKYEDLIEGQCRDFCTLTFTHGLQANKCIWGYDMRSLELIAVDTAMEDLNAQ